MQFNKGIFLIIFSLFLLFNTSYAQYKEGIPFISNYTAKDYNGNGQVWSTVQDSSGIVYFGNEAGVLEFDGISWNRYPLSNQSVVRSLAINNQDQIFVGGIGEMGYLKKDALGKKTYQSILALIPEERLDGLQDIWYIKCYEDKVYYQTSSAIYVLTGWNGGGLEVKIWDFPEGRPNLLQDSDKQLYITSPKGIDKVLKDTFNLLPNSQVAVNGNGTITSIHEIERGSFMLTSMQRGVFFLETSKNTIKYLDNEWSEFYANSFIYNVQKYKENQYALATIRNGLCIINKEGELLSNITKEDGLNDNGVVAIGQTSNNNFFLPLLNGISYVETGFPITIYDERLGYEGGGVHSMLRHADGILYVGGQSGIYSLNQSTNRFELIKNSGVQIWDMKTFWDKEKSYLITTDNDGIYEIENQEIKIILPRNGYSKLINHPNKENILYWIGKNEILEIQRVNNKWAVSSHYVENLVLPGGEFDNEGNLWLSSEYHGVLKVSQDYFSNTQLEVNDTIPTEFITKFDTSHQLPALVENDILKIEGKIYIQTVTSSVLYTYDNTQNKFIENFDIVNYRVTDEKEMWLGKYTIDQNGSIWSASESLNQPLIKQDDGTYEMGHPALKRIKVYTESIISGADGVVWLGTDDGIFRYDTKKEWESKANKVYIRKLIVNADSIVFWGGGIDPQNIFKFDYGNIDRYTFQFASINFSEDVKVEYSYFLEGYDTKWSKWTSESQRSFTNLWEKDYTLKVKARTSINDQESFASYSFKVLPPWYRAWWAYLIYSIIALGLLRMILKLNSSRLEVTNRRLESMVKERTQEVTAQNEELKQRQEEITSQRNYISEQNDTLSKQNSRITDSIRYAQTIQTGVLPFPERLEKYIKDHFILYRPKDIVSGDFYWFEQSGNKSLFAVADCTGHGVPGAFMSMIGISLLNDIVLKTKIDSPAEILTELDSLVNKILKQEADGANQDGMDILICSWEEINDSELKITFCGAKRPLYYSSNNGIETIKGINKSIGGRKRINNREFINEEFTVPKGTKLFLTSDGYIDQDGEEKRKIGTLKLLKILEKNSQKPVSAIGTELENYLNKYQGNSIQRDDITIVGMQL